MECIPRHYTLSISNIDRKGLCIALQHFNSGCLIVYYTFASQKNVSLAIKNGNENQNVLKWKGFFFKKKYLMVSFWTDGKS